jgi:hypothetical protein
MMAPASSIFIMIAALGSIAAEALLVVNDVTDSTHVSDRVADFDRDLRGSGIPGRVRSCTMVVDVTEGRASSNHSYGAICTVQFGGKPREYLLCNDQLVGHFALTSSFVADRNWVADFVKHNCTGG